MQQKETLSPDIPLCGIVAYLVIKAFSDVGDFAYFLCDTAATIVVIHLKDSHVQDYI